MLTLIDGLPDHVIGIRITDKLRAEDYEKQLIPLINERLEKHRKLDFLCCIDGEWKGMEAGAVWQDLRLGLGRIGHWARLAIVSDIGWMENAVKLFSVFSPGELRHFDGDDYAGYTDIMGGEWRFDLDRRIDIGLRASVIHSWSQGTFAWAFGPNVGFSPFTNTWVSVGYNVRGFNDRDFESSHYTAKGAYLIFRMKFDQHSLGLDRASPAAVTGQH